MKKAKKKGTFLIILGLLLVAAALFLVVYNFIDEQRARITAEYALSELEEKLPDRFDYEAKPTPTPAPTTPPPPDEMEYPDYILNPKMDMPTIKVDDDEYIGILSIPTLSLELPVMSEWSYKALKEAPCRYKGSAYLDNLIISAHNYKRHFRYLTELESGAEVIFTDADQNIFRYKVVEVETLMPTAIEEMESGDWDLTLFTCTLGGSYRVTVRCERIDEEIHIPIF